MGRHTVFALLAVIGALLLVTTPPLHVHKESLPAPFAAPNTVNEDPFGGDYEVISFCELPQKDGDESRRCQIVVAGSDGSVRAVTLRAKKSLITDSLRKCSIGDFLW